MLCDKRRDGKLYPTQAPFCYRIRPACASFVIPNQMTLMKTFQHQLNLIIIESSNRSRAAGELHIVSKSNERPNYIN